jgi:hypothetical protein
MTFGRWGFAATTRRANEPGYSAFFVVSTPRVPARGFVEMMMTGRSTRPALTALLANVCSLEEKLGGITKTP